MLAISSVRCPGRERHELWAGPNCCGDDVHRKGLVASRKKQDVDGATGTGRHDGPDLVPGSASVSSSVPPFVLVGQRWRMQSTGYRHSTTFLLPPLHNHIVWSAPVIFRWPRAEAMVSRGVSLLQRDELVENGMMASWAGRVGALSLIPRMGLPAALDAKAMDRIEQLVVACLYALLCWRLLPESLHLAHWFGVMILVSEGTVLAIVLLRRSTANITLRPADWAVAFGGTLPPLLVEIGSTSFLPALGFALITVGWIGHLSAKLTLRRSFGVVAANRGLKTSGVYAIVRHPMYMGYFISHLGLILAVPSLWNAFVYAVTWTCLIARIGAEERVLAKEAEYQAYKARVRYRLIPWVW